MLARKIYLLPVLIWIVASTSCGVSPTTPGNIQPAMTSTAGPMVIQSAVATVPSETGNQPETTPYHPLFHPVQEEI